MHMFRPFNFLIILFIFTSFELFAKPRTVTIIAIAGGTGSGKTTIAQKLHEAFSEHSILISQDSYYKDLSHLPPTDRAKNNFDHPDSIEFSLLQENLLKLINGQQIEEPIYSFTTHSRLKETKKVKPTSIIFVEGILLFAAPELRNLFDIKLFVETADDIRLLRRMERDMKERGREFPGIRDQYLATVKPMHDAFVEPSKQYADMIIPQGGRNSVAFTLLSSYLQNLVRVN